MKSSDLFLLALLFLFLMGGQRKTKETNTQTFEWTDYKGQRRTLTVHREVRRNG